MGAIHAEGFTEELYKSCDKKHYIRDRKVRYSEDATEREYTIYTRKHESIVSFRARLMPGCCGILVVYYVRPTQVKKAKEVFESTVKQIIKTAEKAKFGQVCFTQVRGTTGQAVLLAMGDRYVAPFRNWKTNNEVETFLFKTHYEAPVIVKKPNFDGE